MNGFGIKACLVAIVLSVAAVPSAGASIPDFLDELFLEVRTDYFQQQQEAFETFCTDNDLDSRDAGNRQKYLRVHFVHELLTTTAAVDGARGGILGIPYFWHWVEPNPRHAIRSLPDSIPLTDQRPPAGYERYASRADLDRVPTLFLGDLFAADAGYMHPEFGEFFSFGWCSEREMAFTALLFCWSFESKVWQSGIHTCSVVRAPFRSVDGATVILSARVDNTFDSIDWRVEPTDVTPEQWRGETGDGAQIGWYNRTARSAEQLDALRGIPVSRRAAERIRDRVIEALVD